MPPIPVICIFDVGKTNKKLLLFDEDYKLVLEESTQLPEITDEDGFPCEDVQALTRWLTISFRDVLADGRYKTRVVNFSAYGASFVYLDENKNLLPPLYNYLKPFPADLQKKFYTDHGGAELLALETASPVLGHLNSGMQLYRLKFEKPGFFSKIRYALHLPQYLSYVLSGAIHSDITSVGCHTQLWNFRERGYHHWVKAEGIEKLLPPMLDCSKVAGHFKSIPVGGGLHDSSAALIPYLATFEEPFVLLSTGTWCISLNPFNDQPLTGDELGQDCLCYLTYRGKPVKASRLFAGYEHEQQVKRLAAFFNKPADYFTTIVFDSKFLNHRGGIETSPDPVTHLAGSAFAQRDLGDFGDYETAYHQLIADIIDQQVKSLGLVLQNTGVRKIFVDGGFSRNPVFMNLLAAALPEQDVYTATVAQATALGAAIVMHQHWNDRPFPVNIVQTKLQERPTLAGKEI